MFGNNRLRDIKGANKVGMISVLLDYSPRYVKSASMPDEEPHLFDKATVRMACAD